jgi:hypothetical protein
MLTPPFSNVTALALCLEHHRERFSYTAGIFHRLVTHVSASNGTTVVIIQALSWANLHVEQSVKKPFKLQVRLKVVFNSSRRLDIP